MDQRVCEIWNKMRKIVKEPKNPQYFKQHNQDIYIDNARLLAFVHHDCHLCSGGVQENTRVIVYI